MQGGQQSSNHFDFAINWTNMWVFFYKLSTVDRGFFGKETGYVFLMIIHFLKW